MYRKVSLDAGRYFFGAIYNTIYNLGTAYVFVADQVMPTTGHLLARFNERVHLKKWTLSLFIYLVEKLLSSHQ